MNDMCGRFAFQGDQWPELTADIEQPVIEPNYNICPKDNSPVIHYDSDNLAITSMQWGLRPSWSKESTMEPINARIETIDSKPMFREAYRQRRCLVPANGDARGWLLRIFQPRICFHFIDDDGHSVVDMLNLWS